MRYLLAVAVIVIGAVGIFREELALPSILGPLSIIAITMLILRYGRNTHEVRRGSEEQGKKAAATVLITIAPAILFAGYMANAGANAGLNIELAFKICFALLTLPLIGGALLFVRPANPS